MSHRNSPTETLESWSAIPRLIVEAVDGLTDDEFDRRLEPSGMSPRVLVHHLAEANTVASNIVVAALGSPGCTYDWSWMQPFGAWVDHLGYGNKPVDAALQMLTAVNTYVLSLVDSDEDKLKREIFLRDSPDAELRRVTVADVLAQEFAHAKEHVEEIRAMRAGQ